MYSVLKSLLLLLLVMNLFQCYENQCLPTTYPCTKAYSRIGGPGKVIICSGHGNDTSNEDLRLSLKESRGGKVTHLTISSFNLDKAKPHLFMGLHIQELHLKDTQLRVLPDLGASERTLEIFTLEKAVSERSVQNFTLNVSHLNKLKTLTFINNDYEDNITESIKTISVSNDWFENGPSSLEVVRIFSNKAKSFGDRAFSELVNLTEIDLSFNLIEEIHRSMFPDPANHLRSIDLGYNNIRSLPEDIFSNMPALKKVHASGNPISVLDERIWRPVWERLDTLKVGSAFSLACDSTISWTFDLSRPRRLDAYCDKTGRSYREYRGKSLDKIIDEKQG